MLTRLLKARFQRNSGSSARQILVQALSHDARAGYTPIAFGELATGWTLQVGQVPYDWHRQTSTLYRNGSVLVADFQTAECHPCQEPGRWSLRGKLGDEPFQCSLHSSSLDRRWPYFESVNRVLEYWSMCFVLEAQRHPDWGHGVLIQLGEIEDEVHGLKFHSVAQPVDSHYRVYTHLFVRDRLKIVELKPNDPISLPDESQGIFAVHIRGAMQATSGSPGVVPAREYFWKFLVDEANRFADLHSTRWAVRQDPT